MTKHLLVIGQNSQLAKDFLSGEKGHSQWQVTTAGRGENADWHLDLCKPENVKTEQYYDVAIVFAGQTNLAECEQNPVLAMKTNCEGPLALRQYLNVGAWIVLSTNLVYSGEAPWVDRYADCEPFNVYGSSKAAMEKGFKSIEEPVSIVRLTKVIDQNMPLLKGFIDKLQAQQKISVFSDMNLSPISITAVTHFLWQLVTHFSPGTYHLSGEKDVTYLQIVRYLAKRLKLKESLISDVTKNVASPKFTSLKVDKKEQLYGFEAQALQDALEDFLVAYTK